MTFKKGDKVFKARPYEPYKYCKWGGSRVEVPIGTKGKIIYIDNKSDANVSFDNGINWNVSQTELELSVTKLKDLEYKDIPILEPKEEVEEYEEEEPDWLDEEDP